MAPRSAGSQTTSASARRTIKRDRGVYRYVRLDCHICYTHKQTNSVPSYTRTLANLAHLPLLQSPRLVHYRHGLSEIYNIFLSNAVAKYCVVCHRFDDDSTIVYLT